MAVDVVVGTNDDDAYTVRVTQRIAKRSGERVQTSAPGIIFLEIDGLALPVLRRAMRDGNAPNMARWLADGIARAGRMGDRPLVPDGCEPGRHPAGLEPRHPRVSVGREGDRPGDDLLQARRLRRDRAAARHRHRPARQRRRQPRQPALGRGRRGDPDGQPDQRREAGQPGLPRVLRQRLQRHPVAGAVLLGGGAGVLAVAPGDPPRRAARAATAAASTRSSARRCA